jgi:Meiotically up-regulated gene 113
MPVLTTTQGESILWEPTTDLICSACREPFVLDRRIPGQVNFMFDAGVPDSLERGEYWYFHKRCAYIERALDVRWRWLSMWSVLGKGFAGEGNHPKLQKELRHRMPPGVYDHLYEQWLPALGPRKHRIISEPVYGPKPVLEFVCDECKKICVPEDYAQLTMVWNKAQGSFCGPIMLLHNGCFSNYKQHRSGLKSMPLPELFDINKHSYSDWVAPFISEPLLGFFKPERPLARLKFGKDVWVGNANGLVLVSSGPEKRVAQVKPKRIIQAPQKTERPLKPPKEPKPRKPGKPGHVYLIEAVGSERIKIGHGESAHKRLRQLGTGAPFPLRLLHSIPATDSFAFEQELHARYEVYKVWKEWYILPPAVLAALLKEEAP